MTKIYKVQTPDGNIIKIEGPEGASQEEVIKQAQLLYKPAEQPKAPEKTAGDYVKDFGKGVVSLADTGLNAATGLLDYGAYALARGAGLSPEQAQQETASPKDIFGTALGITQDPAYQQELSRRLTQNVGNFVGENVVQPVAKYTGMPEQDVANMTQSIGMLGGPMMGRAGQAAGRAAYAAEPYVAGAAKLPVEAVKAPVNFAKGVYEGVTKPYTESTSSMVPLREQYTPVPAAQRFMGQMPGVPPQTLEQLQTQARPTSELVSSPIDRLAVATAPTSPEGYPLVPMEGRKMQAWGERVGRGVREKPGQALLEGIGTAVTGIPFKTISQGISELAARRLASRTGFSPEFPQAVQAAQAAQAAQPVQPVQPTPNYPVTVQGPGSQLPPNVIPMGGPQRAVNIEGQRSVLPHQIDTSNSQAQTPKQISQQVAISKIQPVQPAAPAPTVQPETLAPQPTSQPVQPTGVNLPEQRWTDAERLQVQQQMNQPKVEARTPKQIRDEINQVSTQAEQLHQQGLEEGIKYGTPAGEAHQSQLNELHTKTKQLEKELEAAKKAEKKSSKKGPSNVSQMLTDEQAKMWNKLKANENPLEQKLANMSQQHRDIVESEIRKNMKPGDTEAERMLNIFEKYRIKK